MIIHCRWVNGDMYHYTMYDGGVLVFECWIDGGILVNELYDYARRVSGDMGEGYGEVPQMAQRKDLLN